MHDEGPSPEDIERFNRDEAYCPDCGEEIWDQAQQCPNCGAYLAGRTSSRQPVERGLRQRWIILTAVIVLIAFFLTVIGRVPLF